MKTAPNPSVAPYRIHKGPMASDISNGNAGAFTIPFNGQMFTVIISDGFGWDHVSVSLISRTPTWVEMCYFKELFFRYDECVIQYHPSKENYINNHPHCLHLWRPQEGNLPMPDALMVGIPKGGCK